MTRGLILAAGIGSRLGRDLPKALIPWEDGCIVDQQLANLAAAGIEDVTLVLGFEAGKVRDHVGARWLKVRFVENPEYLDTNTAKSMLVGLDGVDEDVVALNGDVVFDAGVLELLLAREGSSIAVDPRVCGDEEVKYRVRDGRLVALSKQVHGEGEAVGINRFVAADLNALRTALAYVEDGAYFERAVEHLLPFASRPVEVVDIGDLRAIEIDFPEDLEAAHRLFP